MANLAPSVARGEQDQGGEHGNRAIIGSGQGLRGSKWQPENSPGSTRSGSLIIQLRKSHRQYTDSLWTSRRGVIDAIARPMPQQRLP